MKKFNPEKELNKIQNTYSTKSYILPIILMAFSIITIAGIAYSTSNTTTPQKYTVKLEIINGKEESYLKQANAGYYEDTIETDATFGSINCIKGNLNYNSETKKVYTDNLTENSTCILSFIDDGSKEIDYSKLAKIYDNDGDSYFYPANTEENYLKYNNNLYRIVRFNGDGTIRLMLSNSIGNYNYGQTNKLEKSNIQKVLNDWYNNNFKDDEKIVEKEFDLDNYTSVSPQNLYIVSDYIYSKVGLLSIREVLLINGNYSTSYISSNALTSNGSSTKKVWSTKGLINTNENGEIYPVINVKYNNLKGRGTEKMPYEIED